MTIIDKLTRHFHSVDGNSMLRDVGAVLGEKFQFVWTQAMSSILNDERHVPRMLQQMPAHTVTMISPSNDPTAAYFHRAESLSSKYYIKFLATKLGFGTATVRVSNSGAHHKFFDCKAGLRYRFCPSVCACLSVGLIKE